MNQIKDAARAGGTSMTIFGVITIILGMFAMLALEPTRYRHRLSDRNRYLCLLCICHCLALHQSRCLIFWGEECISMKKGIT